MRKVSCAALCAAAFLTVNSTAADKAASWGYEGKNGPKHWGDLSEEYALCKTGKMQSPIDLADANAIGGLQISADYEAGELVVLNNGHTVQVNFAEGSTLNSGGAIFNLLQVHFHTPSEEQINGKPYPMIGHFVHANEAGELAVLGIAYEEGASNSELSKVLDHAPRSKAEATAISGVKLDPNKMLPSELNVYRFQGSLTTPPCSEGVNWHVAHNTVTASKEQLAQFHEIMGDNARPIQPLNGRLLVSAGQ